ncbi:MAG: restriction endonuclease subunit S [Candidatus Moranbacteria bacterium]|nr:restriction endonuclease subunit S [Candidatus Moranbacteria bacterium]
MKNVKSKIENFNNLDKSSWDVVRFGDIAFNISERVEPGNANAEIYVGLEHLDSDSIHIFRKGKSEDVKGTKLRVYKGDIIFGKRRAYQRKAAIADFDGICSAHAMVLRANPEKIDPKLFPFFIHSNVFMRRAVDISEGSLSPTIKWKILAEQEFRLPPMEMQKKIAELLWAVDNMEEHYIKSKESSSLLGRAIFNDLTNKKDHLRKLGDCLILSKTKSFPMHKQEKYVGLEQIASGAFFTEQFISSENVVSVCGIFKRGNLLYSKLRPNLDKAVIATFDGVCTTELLVYKAKEGFNLDYILYHLHSDRFIEYAVSHGFGTKMPRISHQIISDFDIYAPDCNEQINILNRLDKIRNAESALLKSFEATRKMRTSLINSIF